MSEFSPIPEAELERLRSNYVEDVGRLRVDYVEAAAKCIANWFFDNYEDPIHDCPRDDGDWACETFHPAEILFENFDGDKVSEEIIDAALDAIGLGECLPRFDFYVDDEEQVSLEMG